MPDEVVLKCPTCGLRRKWREGQPVPSGDVECPCGSIMKPLQEPEKPLAETNEAEVPRLTTELPEPAAPALNVLDRGARETVDGKLILDAMRIRDLLANITAAEGFLEYAKEEMKAAKEGVEKANSGLVDYLKVATDPPKPLPLLELVQDAKDVDG